MELNQLCKEVQKIARSAGEFLKEERRKFDASRVEEKSAHNYVSYVDKGCEQYLVERLSALLPGAGFITEEGSATHTNETYCWVVDPLDGTSNYIHNMAPYCVSIALRTEQEILLGVVYEVCRDECFYAIKGGKAFLNGEEITVSSVSTINDAFIALGFPYSFDEYRPLAVDLVEQLYGTAGGLRLLGSAAAELCYVACGRFEARIEAYLGPWDVAAGGLILQQAGGKLSDFQGADTWQSGHQVIATNGLLHDEILKRLV
ncbi:MULTISPECIES: inositol monophosphatase family protein [unclassified Parabacteroides]|nr:MULTISPECIES: inositol monophosphatase family protein [unclassified Parabacteroides]